MKGRGLLAFVITAGFVLGLSAHAAAEASAGQENLWNNTADLQRLPMGARAAISATLGRDDRSYRAVPVPGGFRAANGRHDLWIDFFRRGVAVASGQDRIAFTLRAAGYGDVLSPVAPAALVAKANRVEYRRGTLTEWYLNGPLGLEQGFTLTSPPVPGAGGPLTLALSVSGSLDVSLEDGSKGLSLARLGGAALGYGGLTAVDAVGRELPARLELAKGTLLLRINDAGARYPVVIDPFVFKATLHPSDFTDEHECCSFGVAVAISGDTIVVGRPNPTTDLPGAAYVFVRPVSGWAGSLMESAMLTPSDSEAADRFGASVAIDGDTVIVGATHKDLGPNFDHGAAYVFVKPGGGWAGALTESAKLTASDGANGDLLGASVAIDGDTVVVGASGDDGIKAIGQQILLVTDHGAAYVFVKPGSGWAGALTESAKLTASDRDDDDHFGGSISMSGDTVVVGVPLDDLSGIDQGSAYVFVEPVAGWAGFQQENAKLIAPGGAAGDAFGTSVAISGDTVLVGAPGNDVFAILDLGSAYVFVEPVAGWAGQPLPAATLFASDGQAHNRFGLQVGVSGDTVLVSVGVNFAAAYIFTKPSGGWVTTNNETQKLATQDGSLQFFSISGNTIVAGSDGLNYARVFVRSYLLRFRNLAFLLRKTFRSGSTIPIELQVDDENGRPIPKAEAKALASACNVQVFFSGGDRSPGCARYDEGSFHFNLKTEKSLPSGRYAITVKVFAGGELVTTETVNVQIRRPREGEEENDEDENGEED